MNLALFYISDRILFNIHSNIASILSIILLDKFRQIKILILSTAIQSNVNNVANTKTNRIYSHPANMLYIFCINC